MSTSDTSNRTEPVVGELGEEYRTRPGTPMIGEFSTNQMDDFYAALAVGEVKETGVMNYLQRLVIAQRCKPGDKVIDVCCGRGLQLPVLYRYLPDLGSYTGLDISLENLGEARARRESLDEFYDVAYPVQLLECDVSQPWPVSGTFDVAIYTSALEHLPRELGVASLRHAAASLAPQGRLFLSTPNTAGDPPRQLQHRVHVYEWSHPELSTALEDVGLVVEDIIGILPPTSPDETRAAVEARYGPGGVAFLQALEARVPQVLLGPVTATGLDEAATEILYVCSRRPA